MMMQAFSANYNDYSVFFHIIEAKDLYSTSADQGYFG